MRTSANTAFSVNVVSFPPPGARLLIVEPDYEWRKIAVARLEQLVRLPIGWDGYTGKPVALLNANFALRMLDAICVLDQWLHAPIFRWGQAVGVVAKWGRPA